MSHDLVRLSPVTLQAFSAFVLQQKITDLTMELMTLHDLLKTIDPDHMYVFSAEYQAFVKTRNPSRSDEEVRETNRIYAGAVITKGAADAEQQRINPAPSGQDLLKQEVADEKGS